MEMPNLKPCMRSGDQKFSYCSISVVKLVSMCVAAFPTVCQICGDVRAAIPCAYFRKSTHGFSIGLRVVPEIINKAVSLEHSGTFIPDVASFIRISIYRCMLYPWHLLQCHVKQVMSLTRRSLRMMTSTCCLSAIASDLNVSSQYMQFCSQELTER